MYGGLRGLMGAPGVPEVDLCPHGMDEVGWEKRWVSLAILGQQDRYLPMLKVDKENWMWTEFGLFWPWRWGRKSKICNGFSFPTLLTNISLVFKFKIEHIFALTGGARPLKRVLVQRNHQREKSNCSDWFVHSASNLKPAIGYKACPTVQLRLTNSKTQYWQTNLLMELNQDGNYEPLSSNRTMPVQMVVVF